MTLNLKLVLSGDAKGAEQAAKRVKQSVADLGASAKRASNQAGTALGGMSGEAGRALQSVGALGTGAELGAAQINRHTNALNMNARAARRMAFQQKLLVFQLNDVFVSLASGMNPMMVAIQQGSQISQIYGPGEGGMGRAFKESGRLITGVITKVPILTAVVAAGAATFAGLSYEIDKSTKLNVTLGDVIKGTWAAAAKAISDFFKPAVEAISPIVAAGWNFIVQSTTQTGNFIINSFSAAFNLIKANWKAFPLVIGGYIIDAANTVISGVEKMINGTITLLNALNSKLPKHLQFNPLGEVKFSGLNNPFKGIKTDVKGILAEAYAQDPLGNAFAAIRAETLKATRKRLGKDKKKKTRSRTERDPVADVISALSFERAQLQRTAREREIYSALKQADTLITTKNGQVIADMAGKLFDERKALEDSKKAMEDAKQIAGGFFAEFRAGLANGEGWWASFKNAALGALDSIIDKLANSGINSLIDGLFKSNNKQGSGGGLFSSIGNALGGLFKFASGGIVDKPTLFGFGGGQLGQMGEAGPEAIMPVTRQGGGFAIGAVANDNTELPLNVTRLASGRLGVQLPGFANGGVFAPSPAAIGRPAGRSGGLAVKHTSIYKIDARGSTMTPEQFETILDRRDKALRGDVLPLVAEGTARGQLS